MSNLTFSEEDMDFSNLAESIMNTDIQSIAEGKPIVSTEEDDGICHIKVSASLVEALTAGEGVFTPVDIEKVPVTKMIEEQTIQKVVETNIQGLPETIQKLSEAIQEAQKLLLELTTVGMIGVNMGGPGKVVKPKVKGKKVPFKKKTKKKTLEETILQALEEFEE